MEINHLKNLLDNLGNKLGRLQGEYSILEKNYTEDKKRSDYLKNELDQTKKAIQLLTAVQYFTRDRIKNQFESLISWGLQYIYQKDYKFVLLFGQRGNLQELKFCVKDPDNQEEIDILDSRGGGIANVISLMLRLVLIEINKINGFIIFDESFANVNGEQNINRLNLFMEEVSKKFKRQIIHITNFACFTENNYNIINLK